MAEHVVDSKAPSVQVVQGMQVATVVCRVALEYDPDGHWVGEIEPLGQNPPAGHSMGADAGVGQKYPAGHTSGANEPDGQ